jgi:hypothetical protein
MSEIDELGRGWLGVWLGMPEYAAMPRAIEAVGGLIAGVLVGDGIVAQVYNMGDPGDPSYETDPDECDDTEMVMIFNAGIFAIRCMCRKLYHELDCPTAFGMRMVATIAEFLRDNRGEVLRLANQLQSTDILTADDIDLSEFKG